MGTERRLDTPERRAAFEQDMKVLVRQIKNERLRTWYADDYQQRLSRLFSGYGSRGGRNRAPITSSRRQDISPPDSRARSLLAYMIQYPGVAQRFLESLSTVEMPDSDFSAVQTRLLTLLSDPGDVPSAADIHARLESEGYGAFLRRLGEDLKMLADAGYTATAATERIEGILAQVQNRDLKKEMAEILAQTRACETDTKKRALWEKYQRLKKELEEETS